MALKPHKDRSSHKHKRDKHRERNYPMQTSGVGGGGGPSKDRGRVDSKSGVQFLTLLGKTTLYWGFVN